MMHASAQPGRALIVGALLLVPLTAVASLLRRPRRWPLTRPASADGTGRGGRQAQRPTVTASHHHAQMPQWNAFAQAMRENATNTDTLFRERAKTVGGMTALDNMKSYAQIARSYADNTEALAQAFAPLYGVLSDQQKQTINTLFREEAAKNTSSPAAKP